MNQEITISELKEIMEKSNPKNYLILDVRTKPEHKNISIKESLNIPLDKIKEHKKDLEKYDTVYIHCQSGARSQKACQELQNISNTKVVNIKGGILAWEKEGLPVIKASKQTYSITQQVHIIAGILILTGVILSRSLHPNFIYLSGFVGAGLLTAGLTGWCTMAKILSKMPWNN